MGVIVISDTEHFNKTVDEAKAAGKKCVVDFTATWCGPCKMIKPYFHELAEEHTDVVFLQVDVDECDQLAAQCGISAMPTFQVYMGRDKALEMVGASKDKLLELVNNSKP